MGASQAELGAGAPSSGRPFRLEGGAVVHPLLARGSVKATAAEVDAATHALEGPTLALASDEGSAGRIAAMVVAERLRQAGGSAFVVAPTRSAARKSAAALKAALADEPATRVEAVLASHAPSARQAAVARAWVLVLPAPLAAVEAEGGRLPLAGCSVFLIMNAERAVGSMPHFEVLRALRRARPKALVVGIAAVPRKDRRRALAAAEAIGARRVDPRAAEGGRAGATKGAVEVVEVDAHESVAVIRALLEAELVARVLLLERAGVMAGGGARGVGRDALADAGAKLQRMGGTPVFAEAARAHAQAAALVEALEVAATRGPRALAGHLEGLASARSAPAERAVAGLEGVRRSAALAAVAPEADVLVEAAVAKVKEQFLAAPGGRAIVVAVDREQAESVRDALRRPPPLGPGLGGELFPGRGAPVVIAAAADAEGLDLDDAGLVVFLDAGALDAAELRSRARAAEGEPPRRILVVARERAAPAGGGPAPRPPARGGRQAMLFGGPSP